MNRCSWIWTIKQFIYIFFFSIFCRHCRYAMKLAQKMWAVCTLLLESWQHVGGWLLTQPLLLEAGASVASLAALKFVSTRRTRFVVLALLYLSRQDSIMQTRFKCQVNQSCDLVVLIKSEIRVFGLIVQTVRVNGQTLYEGDWISLNGSTGEVIMGKQPLAPPAISGNLEIFMSWVDEFRRLKVQTRAIVTLKLWVMVCHECYIAFRPLLNWVELNLYVSLNPKSYPRTTSWLKWELINWWMDYRWWQTPTHRRMLWLLGKMERRELGFAGQSTWYWFRDPYCAHIILYYFDSRYTYFLYSNFATNAKTKSSRGCIISFLPLTRGSKQCGKWSWLQPLRNVKWLLISYYPIRDLILRAFFVWWMVSWQIFIVENAENLVTNFRP